MIVSLIVDYDEKTHLIHFIFHQSLNICEITPLGP